MATLNPNYAKLEAGYLFPEIARRTRAFQEAHPGVKVMKLGIGDTTEPLTPSVVAGLMTGVVDLMRVETYSGYGAEQGNSRLREAIAQRYERGGVKLSSQEIFVSDGAKPDSANIQSIFGLDSIVAVQDPAYPVYVDSNVIAGRTGPFNREKGQYEGLVYMPCTEANHFVPEVPSEKVDLIYLCNPNNPTGAAILHDELKKFVNRARETKALIVYDAAYSAYAGPGVPRSIYEVEGAKNCAIEINSFSKDNGFTGVRLGWTVVPEDLVVEGSKPGDVNKTWNRRQCTFFNGASNIAQAGGLAALAINGTQEGRQLVRYYKENAAIIRRCLRDIGLTVFGGIHAPFILMKTPNGMSSWSCFDKLLEEAKVVGTPGVGFGPSGEGYIRLSALGHREDIEDAVISIQQNLKL